MVAQQLRVGTDLASVSAVRGALERFGPRYLARVYTAHEVDTCGATSPDPARLAARFAAKEAVIKVLRPADDPVDLRDIEIHRAPDGSSEVVLHGGAARLARRSGVTDVVVSMSHEADFAVATALGTVSSGSLG